MEFGQYQLDAKDQQLLMPRESIRKVWPEQPSRDHLQVFVALLAGVDGLTLVQTGERFIRLFALAQDI